MNVFDERVADRYDRYCETEIGQYVDRVERDLLWRLLALRPGLRVVDLGCGTGAYTVRMADAGCRLVGVDRSRAMLSVARAKPLAAGGGAVCPAWMEADVTQLPIPDGQFDRGLVHVALEFVENPARALQEAARVIAPGGRLVVGLILASGPWAEYYQIRGRSDAQSVWHHARFFDPGTLAQWMGRPADVMRCGLWVSPVGWPGATAAAAIEDDGPQSGARPGFAALLWQC